MDFEFHTQKELYDRVKPALHAKLQELKRLNYNGIQELDIWRYLIEIKWKSSKNLMLSDIVSDIIHVDNHKLSTYIKSKNKEEV
ncbi:MAG: hypothetical protein HFJ12_06520 [Bacilli bacterium]|nr:hypothetical protein [Bacilli bacterium]